MRAGIFGGSFNPVHSGHVKLARFAKEELGLDKLIIVPANVSPFKKEGSISCADREAMCRLAFTADEGFIVSGTEINRGGVSFTVDTVSEMTGLFPDCELFLIIGSDMLLQFDKWKEYKRILSMCTLAAVSRQREDKIKELEAFADEKLRQWGKVVIMPFEPLEINSTEIREKLALGEDVSELLPEKVNQYIKDRGLYLDRG